MCIKEVYYNNIVVNAYNIKTKKKDTIKYLFKNVGVINYIKFSKYKIVINFECIFDEVLIMNLFNGNNNIIDRDIIININKEWTESENEVWTESENEDIDYPDSDDLYSTPMGVRYLPLATIGSGFKVNPTESIEPYYVPGWDQGKNHYQSLNQLYEFPTSTFKINKPNINRMVACDIEEYMNEVDNQCLEDLYLLSKSVAEYALK